MYKLNEFCVKRTKCVLLLYYTLSLRLGHLYTAQTNSSRKRIFWKRSSNWRSLKTWALGFRVDGTELFKNDGVAIIKCFPDRVFLKVKSLRFYLKFIWKSESGHAVKKNLLKFMHISLPNNAVGTTCTFRANQCEILNCDRNYLVSSRNYVWIVTGPLLRDNFKLNSPILDTMSLNSLLLKWRWLISVANERPDNWNDLALEQDGRERPSTHSDLVSSVVATTFFKPSDWSFWCRRQFEQI